MRSVRPADIGDTVVVRSPAEDERANAGYHIEGSYDAPTRLLCGSHRPDTK